MAEGKGLAMIFGAPKGARDEPEETSGEEYPPGFEDACEAAFDAIRAKDSRGFCRALHDALLAFEAATHEEGGETEPEEE